MAKCENGDQAITAAEAYVKDQQRREAALEKYVDLRNSFFSEVPEISSEDLLDRMMKKGVDDDFVLVDCRSESERQISILKGAMAQVDFEANVDSYRERDVEIVAYCAIGRRSGLFLQSLQGRYPGIRGRNLAGGIVDWAHAGGPLVDGVDHHRSSVRVHSNSSWTDYFPTVRELQVIDNRTREGGDGD